MENDVSDQQRSAETLALPVRQFIEATAAKQPTPGGGSVAGVVGALAVALGEMTLNYSKGKKSLAQYDQFHEHLAERLRKARGMFEDLVTDDMSAYGMYVSASALPDGPDKTEAVQLALAASIDVPRETAKLALAVLRDLAELSDKCNRHLLSDLKAAAALAAAAARLAHYNVQINTPQLADSQAGQEVLTGSQADVDKAQQMLLEIENG